MKTKFIALVLLSLGCFASEATLNDPRFAGGNQLFRPEGYREWVFVGSGFGMSYTAGKPDEVPKFTNVFIQPEAYHRYVSTGKFPDKTMLVLEIVSPESRASINKQGRFEDKIIGIEAAVKDESRFPEKWAYFSFIGTDGKALDRATSFPKEACWSCHHEHGAADNVFVQFYPGLREAVKASSAHRAP